MAVLPHGPLICIQPLTNDDLTVVYHDLGTLPQQPKKVVSGHRSQTAWYSLTLHDSCLWVYKHRTACGYVECMLQTPETILIKSITNIYSV